jgi:putative DNA primase/helicase
MVYFSRSQPGIAVTPLQLDADPLLFNCANGTVDLRMGKLRAARREDLITRQSNVPFDPGALCPVWEAFLNRIMAGDESLVSLLRRILGYSLTGDVTEKVLFLFLGSGNNGKTTLLEGFRHVAGHYAGVIDIDVLMQDAGNAERERATAELFGKRFVTCSEAEEGRRLNESKVKQLTGMGRQTGRRIYGAPFEFDPQFKLFLDANHRPVIRGSDDAIWNRLPVVPFAVAIPKSEQDPQLLGKLKAEASGILAWAVRGCMEWQANGLQLPDAVRNASEQYRCDMDVVQEFITDRCEIRPEHQVPFQSLYASFKEWCAAAGESPMTATAFGSRLTDKGFAAVRTASNRSRKGLKLKGFSKA